MEDDRSGRIDFLQQLQGGLQVSPLGFCQAEPETSLVQDQRRRCNLEIGFRKKLHQDDNLGSVLLLQQQHQVDVEESLELLARGPHRSEQRSIGLYQVAHLHSTSFGHRGQQPEV